MVLMSAGKAARNQSVIINRTVQSGGSVGGNKKTGTASSAYWSNGNTPLPTNFPVCLCDTSVKFAMAVTTRAPFQRRRNGANVGRGML
jgi:hypothetical protein